MHILPCYPLQITDLYSDVTATTSWSQMILFMGSVSPPHFAIVSFCTMKEHMQSYNTNKCTEEDMVPMKDLF